MKFTAWYPANIGDTRLVSWFAWLPVRIGNEIRWLERVHVEYEYREVNAFFPPCHPYPKWVKTRFFYETKEEEA